MPSWIGQRDSTPSASLKSIKSSAKTQIHYSAPLTPDQPSRNHRPGCIKRQLSSGMLMPSSCVFLPPPTKSSHSSDECSRRSDSHLPRSSPPLDHQPNFPSQFNGLLGRRLPCVIRKGGGWGLSPESAAVVAWKGLMSSWV